MNFLKHLFNTPEDLYEEELGEEVEEEIPMEEEFSGQIAVDIIQAKHELIIIAPIAGIHIDDIDVSLVENVITISGIRKQPELYKTGEIQVEECYFGPFSRSIILPDDIQLGEIRAGLEKGVLTIEVPFSKPDTTTIKIENLETE